MRKLITLSALATLAVAVALSTGAPYDMAAHNLAINSTPAAEVLKVAASHEAMQASMDHPDLPPGMAIVWPDDRGLN